MTTHQYFLCAEISGARHLFDLSSIREVLPAMTLTAARNASPACCGLAQVRGEIVPVFDLARRARALSAAQLILVATTRDGATIGVVVDDVLEIRAVNDEDVVLRPIGGGRAARAVRWSGGVELVLSPDEVFDAA